MAAKRSRLTVWDLDAGTRTVPENLWGSIRATMIRYYQTDKGPAMRHAMKINPKMFGDSPQPERSPTVIFLITYEKAIFFLYSSIAVYTKFINVNRLKIHAHRLHWTCSITRLDICQPKVGSKSPKKHGFLTKSMFFVVFKRLLSNLWFARN
jgi:hypothetical protein